MALIDHSIRELIKQSTDFSDRRIKTVAVLYVIAGFLHGVVDPGVSYIGVEVLDRAYEANPIMSPDATRACGFDSHPYSALFRCGSRTYFDS